MPGMDSPIPAAAHADGLAVHAEKARLLPRAGRAAFLLSNTGRATHRFPQGRDALRSASGLRGERLRAARLSGRYDRFLVAGLHENDAIRKTVEAADIARFEADRITLLSPVPCPGKVLGVGRNYGANAAKGGLAAQEQPRMFAMAGSLIIGRQANLMSQCEPGAMASLSLVACRRQSRPSPHQCGTGVLQRMMRAPSSAAGLWMIVPEPAFAELLERFDGLGSRTRDGRDQRIGKRENGSRRIRQNGVSRRRKKRHVRNRR